MKTFKSFTNLDLIRDKDRLNPVIWNEDESLNSMFRNYLFERSRSFMTKLGLTSDDLEDIRIVGGQAGYSYTDSSDADITLQLKRNLPFNKDEIRRLGLLTSELNYHLRPQYQGIDVNFFVSHRNVGSLRPANQGIYSVTNNDWMKPPTKMPEKHPNHITSKANYFAELIENAINDECSDKETCASELYKKLKKFREKSLQTKKGELSTGSLVWRLLSRSGYIEKLKEKINTLENNYWQMKKPAGMITNEEFKMLIKKDSDYDLPSSIVKWNTRVLRGESPLPLIKRLRPILGLFDHPEM